MRKFFIYFLLLLAFPTSLLAQTTVTVGTSGEEYLTLKEAFDDINAGGIKGVIILQIIDNTDETTTAVLNASGTGAASYTSILIYPTGSGYSISGSVNGPLIDLNGADNVTFDGRVDHTGSAKDLVISNTSTSNSPGTSTIRFINDATSNIVKYCTLKGSSTDAASGIIFFSLTSGTTGNDGNTIQNNNITNSADGYRPLNVIYSSGTASKENSGNIIQDNYIYNFFNKGTASNGINLDANTTTWTISGNSFYETASFVPTASFDYNVLLINNTGTGFTITGNSIGGQAVSCGGSAWTKTSAYDNTFIAIYLNVGTGTASNVQNNTVQNFAWSNSTVVAKNWTGIQVAGGDVNIGTGTGNTIGAATLTGSITVTGGATNTNVYGINIAGSGTVNCQNNIIGSITAANSAATATNFYGINSTCNGTVTISSNNIGSSVTSSSINASSISSGANPQVVFGINNTGSGTITINSNTISKLTNGTTNTGTTRRGLINGISSSSSSGTNTISNNTIYDLTIANANNAQYNTASLCGISLVGAISRTVSGNIIYNLSNTRTSFGGYINGLYFEGIFGTGTNVVNGNFIHSLTVDVSTTSAKICGIQIYAGATTYSNNIISLGGNTQTTIYGIYETGVSGNNNNLYFNTVYIGGSVASGSNKTYALYSAVTTNSRDFRNNVLVSTRSTTGGSHFHYAAYISTTGGTITCDYNDYYASGTGNELGYYGSDKDALPIVDNQDANSYAIDPVFATYPSPPGTTATDYKIGVDFIGVSGAGIPTTDYGLNTRYNPTMGAWERAVNKWKGASSNDWNTAGNWTANQLPFGNNINIIFDASPVNHLYMDANHSVNNITNGSSKKLVTNGKQLTIKGNLTFTSGAQIDATSASSTLVYAGASAQTIDANNFVSGKTINLTIDNTPGVTLNTDFTVDNALTINSGKHLTVSAGKLLTVTGSLTNSAGNSGLVIKSDAYGNDGKLINNTASVPATVELYLSGGTGGSGPIFHYIVPPVTTMTIGTTPTIAETKTALGLTNFVGDLMSYSESAAGSNKDLGWQYFDGYTNGGMFTASPFTSIVSSKGYNFRFTAADKITFTGTLNDSPSDYSFNLNFSNLGWNLIGNPYPCNYDLNSVTELNNTDNVDNTIYFNYDGGYGTYNVLTNISVPNGLYSDIVAPMQGFFVHVTAAATLNLPIADKTANTAAPLRSKGADIIKKIRLKLNNGIVPDETVVCLIDKATSGFDGDYDAYKLFGNGTTTPYIYTELNSVKYAINSIKDPGSSSAIIPVTVVLKTDGTYKIDITEFENLDGYNVVLKHGAIETTLSKNASYTFTSAAGTFTDYQLVFGNIATDVEKLTTENLKTWYSNNYLYINCPDVISSDKGKIVIYDIQGKTVYTNNLIYLAPGQTIQLPLNLPKGVYITHVFANNRPYISKIVVF